MTNTSLGAPLQRLVDLYAELNLFPVDASFSASLAELSETSWNSSAAFGGTASPQSSWGFGECCWLRHGLGSPEGLPCFLVLLSSIVGVSC